MATSRARATTHPSGRHLVAALMAEYITSEGLLYTRASLYAELLAQNPTNPETRRMADYCAFQSPALTPDNVARIRAYWQGAPASFWNRTGEVPILPLDV